MAQPQPADPALLFVGLLWRDASIEEAALQRLEASFGAIAWQSDDLPWDYSTYYRDELGAGIRRRFLVLGPPLPPDRLAEHKLATNAIEDALAAADGRRRINIDPGMLSVGNLVLASAKPSPVRIAIGQGMWAELTLLFHEGAYRRLLWTYPDYAEHAALFLQPRHMLLEALRQGHGRGERA